MSENIVDRLFGSFSVLEGAIVQAREILNSRPNVKADVLARLDAYSDLLSKQRVIATELHALIQDARWQEVSQKISLINGLLEMIRSDAREVLSALSKSIDEDSEEDDTPKFIC